MTALTITDETFDDQVLKASTPVLVDFWSEQCGPCKMLSPILHQIADEQDGTLTVAKVNIAESPSIPARYGVRRVPTLMLFRDGQMVSTMSGAVPKQKILDWIESL
jgi:thioredoxin 1